MTTMIALQRIAPPAAPRSSRSGDAVNDNAFADLMRDDHRDAALDRVVGNGRPPARSAHERQRVDAGRGHDDVASADDSVEYEAEAAGDEPTRAADVATDDETEVAVAGWLVSKGPTEPDDQAMVAALSGGVADESVTTDVELDVVDVDPAALLDAAEPALTTESANDVADISPEADLAEASAADALADAAMMAGLTADHAVQTGAVASDTAPEEVMLHEAVNQMSVDSSGVVAATAAEAAGISTNDDLTDQPVSTSSPSEATPELSGQGDGSGAEAVAADAETATAAGAGPIVMSPADQLTDETLETTATTIATHPATTETTARALGDVAGSEAGDMTAASVAPQRVDATTSRADTSNFSAMNLVAVGTASPASVDGSGLAAAWDPSSMKATMSRIAETIEAIASQPPPRAISLDFAEVHGIRIRVAVDANGINVTVTDAGAGSSQTGQWQRQLSESMDQRQQQQRRQQDRSLDGSSSSPANIAAPAARRIPTSTELRL